MIDIHTHILPGIDDGSKSSEESIQMLRTEARQGIDEVVLTPHFYADQNSISEFLERRERAWNRLEPHLTDALPQLRLGAEVQYFEGICRAEGLERLKIQDSDLLLLEMPFSKWSERMVEDVLELNDRDDMQILLAHVERYISFENKKYYSRLLDDGVLFQSNISFFMRWQTRLEAMSMLNKGMIHVLGSDCHSMKHRPPAWDALPVKVRERSERMSLLFSRNLSQGNYEFV